MNVDGSGLSPAGSFSLRLQWYLSESAVIILLFRSAPNLIQRLGLNQFSVHLWNPYLCDLSYVCPAEKDTSLEADSWQPQELWEWMFSVPPLQMTVFTFINPGTGWLRTNNHSHNSDRCLTKPQSSALCQWAAQSVPCSRAPAQQLSREGRLFITVIVSSDLSTSGESGWWPFGHKRISFLKATNWGRETSSESCCFSPSQLPASTPFILILDALLTAFRETAGDSWCRRVALTIFFLLLFFLPSITFYVHLLVFYVRIGCSLQTWLCLLLRNFNIFRICALFVSHRKQPRMDGWWLSFCLSAGNVCGVRSSALWLCLPVKELSLAISFPIVIGAESLLSGFISRADAMPEMSFMITDHLFSMFLKPKC